MVSSLGHSTREDKHCSSLGLHSWSYSASTTWVIFFHFGNQMGIYLEHDSSYLSIGDTSMACIFISVDLWGGLLGAMELGFGMESIVLDCNGIFSVSAVSSAWPQCEILCASYAQECVQTLWFSSSGRDGDGGLFSRINFFDLLLCFIGYRWFRPRCSSGVIRISSRSPSSCSLGFIWWRYLQGEEPWFRSLIKRWIPFGKISLGHIGIGRWPNIWIFSLLSKGPHIDANGGQFFIFKILYILHSFFLSNESMYMLFSTISYSSPSQKQVFFTGDHTGLG